MLSETIFDFTYTVFPYTVFTYTLFTRRVSNVVTLFSFLVYLITPGHLLSITVVSNAYLRTEIKYRVIQKDRLKFVRLYFLN